MLNSSKLEAVTAALQAIPLITSDLPGIGGRIKEQPEDFFVEEIPAYEPCGDGEHLFLQIEKRDISGDQLLQEIARQLNVAFRDIGTAGTKDKRAVTRQWISVPAACEQRLAAFNAEGIQILETRKHGNKLRTGHLRGNRFSILIRDVNSDAVQNADVIRARIQVTGMPNYFGGQRFGSNFNTLVTGLRMLESTLVPIDRQWTQNRFVRRMAISAVQSAVFNLVLAERIRDGLFQTVFPGDVMQVVESGGLFVVEDVKAERLRFGRHEIATTGPIFGAKMRSAEGEISDREENGLAALGLEVSSFNRVKKLASGTRRPLMNFVDEISIKEETEGLRFDFALPPGSYATVLLREFMKHGVADAIER